MNTAVLMQGKRETFDCWIELHPCSAPSVCQALFYTQVKLIRSPTSPTSAGRRLITEHLPFTQKLPHKVKESLTRLHRTPVSCVV